MKLYELNMWSYETATATVNTYEVEKATSDRVYFTRQGNTRRTSVLLSDLGKVQNLRPRVGDGDMHNRVYVVGDDDSDAMADLFDIIRQWYDDAKIRVMSRVTRALYKEV